MSKVKQKISKPKSNTQNTFLADVLKYAAISLGVTIVLLIVLNAKQLEIHPFLHLVYFFLIGMLILCVLNPCSKLHRIYTGPDKTTLFSAAAVVIFLSCLCTAAMSLNPAWNGEIPEHRNQYEELAEAILEGHLDVHTEEDVSALMEMDNPYDAEARSSQGVSFQWDHAFYNGHYYVYFGIVPALLLFVPYRVLTGNALTTWKGTAVFSIFIIVAIFLFAYQIIKKSRAKVPLTVYLILCSNLSLLILWYAVEHPALYCTAIISGICFALWSLYFFYQAFCVDEKPRHWKILLGALCGALVFGCRPPIGVAEITLLPLLYIGMKKQISKKEDLFKKESLIQVCAFILPYIIVAVALMIYNYLRFESPFEFGQSYQLTVTDQTAYTGGIKDRFSIVGWLNYTLRYFFNFVDLQDTFPWITQQQGLFIMHPILFLAFIKWNLPKDEKPLKWFHRMIFISIALIIEFQVLNSPFLEMRYCMDFAFLLALAVLFYVFYKYTEFTASSSAEKKYNFCMIALSLFMMAIVFLHFFTSGDASLAEYDIDKANQLSRFFIFHNLRGM